MIIFAKIIKSIIYKDFILLNVHPAKSAVRKTPHRANIAHFSGNYKSSEEIPARRTALRRSSATVGPELVEGRRFDKLSNRPAGLPVPQDHLAVSAIDFDGGVLADLAL